jgi:hypothetical protein
MLWSKYRRKHRLARLPLPFLLGSRFGADSVLVREMIRTHTALFSATEVMGILARHVIAERGLEPAENSQIEGELMAVADRDELGEPVINQYRLQIKVAEAEWRG